MPGPNQRGPAGDREPAARRLAQGERHHDATRCGRVTSANRLATHDGLTGVVTAIDGTNDTLYVRIDGERWRTMAPILLAREEVVPADTEESE